ncbi:MAG: hypothetical protein H6666_10390 [Ardenticatenaceae bacterium]|nr:hypothetical protein [Anaerolineales bacterium]MCB8918324.1 hypothetical protein [Ardenticatenaceae bacterium]
MSELLGLLIGFLLTLFVYSYVVGDNALYRFAVHVLVGVTAAYAAVVVVQRVFGPIYQQIRANPGDPANLWWLVPLIFTLLLVLKLIRPVAWVGNSAVAILLGVGGAVALVGAIAGTLLPQIAAPRVGGPAGENGFLTLLAAFFTICTLLYFQFTGRADEDGNLVMAPWQRVVSGIGRAVLMITFGALFAGLLSTSLVLLVDRLSYFLSGFVSALGALLS